MASLELTIIEISMNKDRLSEEPSLVTIPPRPIIRYKQWTQDVEEEILEGYEPGDEYLSDPRPYAKDWLFNTYNNSKWYSARYLAGKTLSTKDFVPLGEVEEKRTLWIEAIKSEIMKKERDSKDSFCDLRHLLRDYDWAQDKNQVFGFIESYLESIQPSMGFFQRWSLRRLQKNKAPDQYMPKMLAFLVAQYAR